jgi:hypothetical protein
VPILTSAVEMATRRLPKVVSPKTHAVIDYVTVGAFLVAGALFWRKNRRAAVGSLLCGGAELAVNLLTDYPGGRVPFLSFETHGKLEVSLAAMAATMPELMAFPDDAEKNFFLAQSGVITIAANLTDFRRPGPELARNRKRGAA